jgi:hypothetical protein
MTTWLDNQSKVIEVSLSMSPHLQNGTDLSSYLRNIT